MVPKTPSSAPSGSKAQTPAVGYEAVFPQLTRSGVWSGSLSISQCALSKPVYGKFRVIKSAASTNEASKEQPLKVWVIGILVSHNLSSASKFESKRSSPGGRPSQPSYWFNARLRAAEGHSSLVTCMENLDAYLQGLDFWDDLAKSAGRTSSLAYRSGEVGFLGTSRTLFPSAIITEFVEVQADPVSPSPQTARAGDKRKVPPKHAPGTVMEHHGKKFLIDAPWCRNGPPSYPVLYDGREATNMKACFEKKLDPSQLGASPLVALEFGIELFESEPNKTTLEMYRMVFFGEGISVPSQDDAGAVQDDKSFDE